LRLRFAGWRLRRFSGLLPLLLLPTLLLAQSEAWTDFLTTWVKTRHAPITLLVPKDRLTPAYSRSDEPLLFLTAAGDLGIQALEGPVLDGLREARGWKGGSHWILLGQDGGIVDEGTDLPKGEVLQSRLQGLGVTPTWEALDQFLKLHPDNGSALRRRLSIATSLVRRRFLNLRDQGKVEAPKISTEWVIPTVEPAKITDPALQGEWCRELEDTLNRLNQLPDPWRLGERSFFQFWLDFYGKTTSLGFRRELTRLNASILEAWRRNPHSGRDFKQTMQDEGDPMGLGRFWMSCDGATRPSGELPELPLLTPSPGRFWPDQSLLFGLPWSRPDGANATDILSFLDRLPTETMPSLLWDDAWSEWLAFINFKFSRRAMALASLGHWQEAALALQECRRCSGEQWSRMASFISDQFSKNVSPNPPGKADVPVKVLPPEVFLEVLRSPPMEGILPPSPPLPLRFLTWGQPTWIARWEELRSTPALAPWNATELKREAPREADTVRLTQAGFPAIGWAVFQGDSTIVTRGEGAPDATSMAVQLRSVAPSRIQVLDDFVAKHPEHLDARRDRFAMVRARMPQAALEARLMEDAAKTFFPLDFGPEAPWISDPKGWQAHARKVVPELEAVLQRWPDNAGLWRAWIAWSAFLPKPPSVVTYATGLPVFGPRQGWTSLLPAEVHRAVAKECRNGRKFELLADWFDGAWASLVSRVRPTDSYSQIGEREKAIYEGYRETLTLLGRTADRADLDRAWASLQPKAKGASPS
jgi:hypothetical protein